MTTGAVHTLYLAGRDLAGSDLPAVRQSLHAAERAELALLVDERRRREWLAGRWVAKQLLVRAGVAGRAADVEICSRDEQRRSCRPRVRIGGEPLRGSLSIAHTTAGALAALTTSDRMTLGIDLVDLDEMAVTSRRPGFARLWFTPLERCWISGDPMRRSATVWGIKEAVYKACLSAAGWSPREIEVWPQTTGYRCVYRGRAIDGLRLEVEQVEGQLAVVASLLHFVGRTRAGAGRRLPGVNGFGESSQHEFLLEQAS